MKPYKLFTFIAFGTALISCNKDEEPEPDDNGRTKASFTTNWKKIWGTSYGDDFSGAVSDQSGNIYFTGSSQPDGYAADIFVTKINPSTPSLSWSVSLNAGDQDNYPSPSENGHSQGGGGSRCIAIDDNNDIYIAGRSVQGYNEVFIVKLNSSGTILWQKFWEASSTGLSNGSAKAYALDVKGGKVFVTGSCGAGVATEEAMAFLLVLNATDGSIDPATRLGIDLSPGYNDRGYTVKSPDGNTVYIAGWEGQNNSGFVSKYSASGATHEWTKKVGLGTASRITDIDLDASGNLYLAVDYRGVSTFIGVMKMDSNGNLSWSKKFQGVANDRNNVSCLRVINNTIYVGGRGSFTNYDESSWGDGCLLKLDVNGNLLSQYNFFTAEVSDDRCGERIEAILPYGSSVLLLGETWPEYSQTDGHWYVPAGTISANTPSVTAVTPTFQAGTGVFSANTMTLSNLTTSLNDLSVGSAGSADVVLFRITE